MSVISDVDEALWAASENKKKPLRELMKDKIWEMVGAEFGYPNFKPEFVKEKAFKKHHRFGKYAEKLKEMYEYSMYPKDEELVQLFFDITRAYSKQM